MKVLVLACVLISSPVLAQNTVQTVGWADAASWGTAFVTPGIATYQASRSKTPQCRLSQLLVSAGLANGIGLGLQRAISSPRPSGGGNGFPSLHVANSFVGSRDVGGWSVIFSASTAVLRIKAKRHTVKQVVGGAALGLGADFLSRKLVRC